VAAQGAVFLFSPPNRRRRAVAEEACADHDARVIVQVKRGRADLDGDAGHIERGIGSEDGRPGPQSRNGRAATQTDDILQPDVTAQPERLGHVAAYTRTQIAGARCDDKDIKFAGGQSRLLEGAGQSASGQVRRGRAKFLVQSVCIESEKFLWVVQGKLPACNTGIPAKNGLQGQARPPIETCERLR